MLIPHCHLRPLLLLFLGALVLQGCGPIQPAFLAKRNPHEKYSDGLEQAGLQRTALGREWMQAAENALADTIMIVTPFLETTYFPAEKPAAQGYRIQARRGEKIRIKAEVNSEGPINVFMDVFELRRGGGELKHVASAEEELQVEFVAGRDREYVVRVQPELLRSARITITMTTGASLSFPIAGQDSKSIRSFFGDGRDAGKRKHEGVDAFAPKGQPVVSVSDGTARAANNRLGGKVVWVYDHQNQLNLYYAHLDSQYVGVLQQVKVGDTLGTVGNTGNAKHTPPHLHFGIYARGEGAVDPLPFLNTPLQEPAPITADLEMLEKPARIRSRTADLRISPSAKAEVIAQLPEHTFIAPTSATGEWYRVRQGIITGYVRAKDVVGVEKPVRTIELAQEHELLDSPVIGAAPIRDLQAGENVELLALNGEFQKVRTQDQELGWIAMDLK